MTCVLGHRNLPYKANLKIGKFLIFWGGRFLNIRYPKHFTSFLLLSDDIKDIKYLIKKLVLLLILTFFF